MALTYPCYWLYKDNQRQWRWTYYAKNGEEIGVSSEGYRNYDDCLNGVKLMQASSGSKVYYNTDDKD